ncbi:ADOP family duplicated permease [Terracidiphilus sp.]|uniref:ABC transporter permease n=1 Tax=Terracidiphilus sp. TaxID=1964191 RepID=UPI003C204619
MLGRFFTKLRLLARRKRFRSELDEEMEFHRAQSEREFVSEGMSPKEAYYAAMRQFGNATRLREQSEEAVGFRMETVIQDLGFALRQLRKNPGFGVTAVLILALGIGVSVAIFGFVDAALIQPLPFAQPNRLVDIAESSALFPRSNISRPDYEDWRRYNTTLSSLEAFGGMSYLLHMGGATEPVPALRVSDGFFRVLGVKPILGRDFLPGEDQPGRAKIVMLPYSTWQKRFGGRKDVIGQSVDLSGDNYTIVGVLSREFVWQPRGNAEFFTPLLDKNGCEKRRSCHNLWGVGRLRDGIRVDAARADFKRISAELEAQYPSSNKGQSAAVESLAEAFVGDIRPILFTLLGGAALLLVIACVNVASLLLVRSESRRREIAVRGALGATKARLARQFVTEGLLLTAFGCAAGLLVAAWTMALLGKLVPKSMADGMPFLSHAGLNAHTIIFAAAVATLAAFMLAVTPALRLGEKDLQHALSEGGRGAAGRFWQRLGANLVIVELTVAVVLLAGAGLLGRSFYRLLHVETGFDPTHLATVNVIAPDSKYKTPDDTRQLYLEIERRLMALPGVQSVGMTTDLPVQCNCDTDWIRIVGKPFHGEHNEVDEREVSPNYLATLKAKLIRGRMINAQDDASHPQVIVINESLAKKYFPGEDPIGHKIGNGELTSDSMREIVGVISDVREGGLQEDQWPAEYEAIYRSADTGFTIAARTAGDEKALLPTMVNTLRQVEPGLGIYDEQTMEQQIDSSETALLHKFAMWLVGIFAALALVLGVIGLYGVIAYSVSQRTREIGVRMALGAQRSTVYKLVMRQAAWLTAAGLALGLACSVGVSTLMQKLLFGVQAWDAPTLLAVALILGVAALAASFIPAWRAASVNPTEALRAE